MNTIAQRLTGGGDTRASAHGARATRRALFVLPLASAVFVASALWSPSDLPGVVLCPLRALTGYPCPGCGMTRAFCAIGHGEFALAVGYNALSPLLFLAMFGVWAHALATILKLEGARAALERMMPGARAAKLLLALTLVWWVVRLKGGF
ncbi:MAG TPA: DUF2752 domain-containing protein [Pyrinomonadaceae bacterium]|nr:DUF2752 domain-containing protein [Pyrinomonadaceae bacterium]